MCLETKLISLKVALAFEVKKKKEEEAKVVLKISVFEVNAKGNQSFLSSRFCKHNVYEPKENTADLNLEHDVKVLLMPCVLYSNNS